MSASIEQNEIAYLRSHYPAPADLDYIERQTALFDQKKAELLTTYLEQYVWFEDGQVLDADVDERALIQRIYQTVGMRPIFVEKVVAELPNIRVHTPFFSDPLA